MGNKSRSRRLRAWILVIFLAVIAAVATLYCVNSANAEWCDSALAMSEEFMEPHKGGLDYNTATTSQIKDKLPQLETAYKDCEIREDGHIRYEGDLQRTGWDLALAYLKLHRKGDAVKVLKVLSSIYKGSALGDHCTQLLEK